MFKKTRDKSSVPPGKKAVAGNAAPAEGAATFAQPPEKRSAANKAAAPASASILSTLTEGDAAPAFTLPCHGGEISLLDYAGKKLVIFFFPRADTPGCTIEAIDFTRLNAAFMANGAAVIGVSADPPEVQNSFRDRHALTTPLLSDEGHAVIETYGAWGQKSMYGRTFHGLLRSTVLIDEDGRIARVWRRVKVEGHADAVLDAVRDSKNQPTAASGKPFSKN